MTKKKWPNFIMEMLFLFEQDPSRGFRFQCLGGEWVEAERDPEISTDRYECPERCSYQTGVLEADDD